MPPIVNMAIKPMANSMGVLKCSLPPHMVASQAKILIPVGTPIRKLSAEKNMQRQGGHAGGEHMVRPNGKGQHADGDPGKDNRFVPKQRLAREDRNDLGDNPEGRQDQDIDLRVAEEPEQVLPEQRVAALGDVVEMGAQQAVEQQ